MVTAALTVAWWTRGASLRLDLHIGELSTSTCHLAKPSTRWEKSAILRTSSIGMRTTCRRESLRIGWRIWSTVCVVVPIADRSMFMLVELPDFICTPDQTTLWVIFQCNHGTGERCWITQSFPVLKEDYSKAILMTDNRAKKYMILVHYMEGDAVSWPSTLQCPSHSCRNLLESTGMGLEWNWNWLKQDQKINIYIYNHLYTNRYNRYKTFARYINTTVWLRPSLQAN